MTADRDELDIAAIVEALPRPLDSYSRFSFQRGYAAKQQALLFGIVATPRHPELLARFAKNEDAQTIAVALTRLQTATRRLTS